jgi:hypothetical protein
MNEKELSGEKIKELTIKKIYNASGLIQNILIGIIILASVPFTVYVIT